MATRIAPGLLAAALAVAAQAREPHLGTLKSYSQPGYTLITHNESAARRLVPDITRFEGVLFMFLDTEVRPTGTPTYIYIVHGSVWNRYLQPSTNIIGEFVPARFSNYLLLTDSLVNQPLRGGVFHEYTHMFLRTQFSGAHPLWFDEGLAEFMQETRFEGSEVVVGTPLDVYAPGWVPLERLLRIDKSSPEYLRTRTHSVHVESWAMVHKGLIGDRAFGAQMFNYLNETNNGVAIDAAVQKSFGMSVADLDRQMNAYLGRKTFKAGRFRLEPPPPVTLGMGRVLSETEAFENLAGVMLDTGFNPSHVAEVIEAARQRSPESASVAILQMRLAVRDRDDAALERLYRAIEPGTKEAATARGVGLALFERVREDRSDERMSAAAVLEMRQRAFALLDRALRGGPIDAEAAWGYGMLAARLKVDLETALERLALAKTRVPRNSDLSMATALVHEAALRTDAMIPHLTDTARFSHAVEQRLWALRRLQAIRRGADAAAGK